MNILTFKLTDGCNLRCEYCYQRGLRYPGRHMSLDVARRAVTLFEQSRGVDAPRGSIRFSGGEPLLNYGVVKGIVEEWGDRMMYTLITNGTLIEESSDLADLIRAHDIELYLSIDGDSESHDINRKTV